MTPAHRSASVLLDSLFPDPWMEIDVETNMPKCELAFYMALECLDENGPDGNKKATEKQKVQIASQQVDAALKKAYKAMEKLHQLSGESRPASKRTKTGHTFLNTLYFQVPNLDDGLLHPRFLHLTLKQWCQYLVHNRHITLCTKDISRPGSFLQRAMLPTKRWSACPNLAPAPQRPLPIIPPFRAHTLPQGLGTGTQIIAIANTCLPIKSHPNLHTTGEGGRPIPGLAAAHVEGLSDWVPEGRLVGRPIPGNMFLLYISW